MSNEERNKEVRKRFNGDEDQEFYYVHSVDQIQDLTRADEREKVIREVEGIVNGDIYTDEDGNNLVDVEKLRANLKSLRDAK